MLTKGIIQAIDYNDNTCTVRMPLFETAGTRSQFTAQSVIVSLPGVYGGYKVNDVVILGFENEEYGSPIIVGKLFLGNAEESTKEGGAINCSNLIVGTSAVLPAETKLNYKKPANAITNAEATLITYDSIQDIAEAVALNSKRINNINNSKNTFSETEQVIGSWIDGSLLYQKTFYYTNDTFVISLADIDFNVIWIDTGQSFYVDDLGDNNLRVGNPLLTYINLRDRTIDIPQLSSNSGYGYVTVKYTKRTAPVTLVAFNRKTLNIQLNGQAITTATVLPAWDTKLTLKWEITSGEDNIEVTVADRTATIKGVAEGEAVIKVTSIDDPTKYDECTITIVPAN